MSVNDRDLSALEYLAGRIRQDTPGAGPWDAEGMHIVFARELKGIHLVTALEMVLHHAADVDAKTPGAITRKFKPELVPPRPRGAFPPKKSEECPQHVGQLPPPHCAIHATEGALAWYDLEANDSPEPITSATSGPELVRDELRKAVGK